MKRGLSLVLLAVPVAALAGDEMFGTKSLPAAPPTSGSLGTGPIVQMVFALLLVLGLVRWVMPKVLNKFGNRLSTNLNGGIRVEESAAFAGGNLYVVNARGKVLLISVASGGVSCLADLTEAPAAEPVAMDVFESILDAATEADDEPAPIAVVEASDAVSRQLERLRRLAG